MHNILLDPDLVTRLKRERGGQLHSIQAIDPARTAHIIIDMQNGFMEPGAPVEVPMAREIVPQVNRISAAMRAAGGLNVFVSFTTPVTALDSWSSFYRRFPEEEQRAHQQAFEHGAHHWQLWPELEVDETVDVRIEK